MQEEDLEGIVPHERELWLSEENDKQPNLAAAFEGYPKEAGAHGCMHE